MGCSWGPGQPQPSVWGSAWGLGNTWGCGVVVVSGLGIWLGEFLGDGAAPTFGLGEHLGFGEHLGLRGGRGFRSGDLAWGALGGRGSPNLRFGGALGVWGTLGVAGWSWFPVWGSGLGCSWGPGQPQPSVWGSAWGLRNTWGCAVATKIAAVGSSSRPKEHAMSEQIGRNDPCPCGSGKKYKKCHGLMDEFPGDDSGVPVRSGGPRPSSSSGAHGDVDPDEEAGGGGTGQLRVRLARGDGGGEASASPDEPMS